MACQTLDQFHGPKTQSKTKICTQICKRNPSQPIYRASRFVVVPVHCWASIRSVLPGISKLSGHQHPKLGIFAAATPLPALPRRSLVVGVTAAHGGRSLGAGTCHCECHSCWGYGVDKRWLPGSWEGQVKTGRKRERNGECVSFVFNMHNPICTAAIIQTEAVKGVAPGDSLLTFQLWEGIYVPVKAYLRMILYSMKWDDVYSSPVMSKHHTHTQGTWRCLKAVTSAFCSCVRGP